ncbi:hypothetical protein MCP1_510006 [Candidatus Terasakiella magnetica]|nr:hypothetical protein MCP1_510006 [Candidatus Terasakiella magnetica]
MTGRMLLGAILVGGTIFSGLACLPASLASAETEVSPCQTSILTEMSSLQDLPAPVRSLLHADQSGLGGMADRGQSYNTTDSVDDRLPMCRFAGGGQGDGCVVIAVQRGGRSSSVQLMAFELIRAGWAMTRSTNLQAGESIHSVRDLVTIIYGRPADMLDR